MAFITISELKTHLYTENVDVINRGDDTITQSAIDAAIAEAKSYLGAYDATTIFARTGTARNALLVVFVKDIAAWHFLVLCNAGTELQLRQDRYERAIAWLKAVQKGDVNPDLPLEEDEEGEETGIIIFGSNDKRDNHY